MFFFFFKLPVAWHSYTNYLHGVVNSNGIVLLVVQQWNCFTGSTRQWLQYKCRAQKSGRFLVGEYRWKQTDLHSTRTVLCSIVNRNQSAFHLEVLFIYFNNGAAQCSGSWAKGDTYDRLNRPVGPLHQSSCVCLVRTQLWQKTLRWAWNYVQQQEKMFCFTLKLSPREIWYFRWIKQACSQPFVMLLAVEATIAWAVLMHESNCGLNTS